MLEWFAYSFWSETRTLLWAQSVLIPTVVLLALVLPPWAPLGIWLGWVCLGSLRRLPFGRRSFAAGADWLQTGQGWVDLYEMESISRRVRGFVDLVELRDRSGREIRLGLCDLQGNPDLWALVHAGIRNSDALRPVRMTRGMRRFLFGRARCG